MDSYTIPTYSSPRVFLQGSSPQDLNLPQQLGNTGFRCSDLLCYWGTSYTKSQIPAPCSHCVGLSKLSRNHAPCSSCWPLAPGSPTVPRNFVPEPSRWEAPASLSWVFHVNFLHQLYKWKSAKLVDLQHVPWILERVLRLPWQLSNAMFHFSGSDGS